ncbi:MAG: phage tail protein I [Azoarcus sp.]|jgi:phage tail P2-like protein|nr:phage tail protein I [Azoarcus sp.]
MSDASRLLPPNSTPLERALVDAVAMERLAPEAIAALWHPFGCPAPNLPWLGWALSVDEWDVAWDEQVQRQVIAASIEIHRKKGTVGAVKQALVALGHTGRLVEWWQATPPGVPHTFVAEVEVDDRGIDLAAQLAIERQIAAVKPARSHFTMHMVGATYCRPRAAFAVLCGEAATVYPNQIEEADAPDTGIDVGIGVHAWSVTTVYPKNEVSHARQ